MSIVIRFVFKPTILFFRSPVEDIPKFRLNFDRVAISRWAVQSVISCVQNLVRNPLFTRRNFSRENGVSMLLLAVRVAGTISEGPMYDSRNCMLLKDIEPFYGIQ